MRRLFLFSRIGGEENIATWLTRRELKVAETPDKEPQGDKPPETVQLRSPSRVTATVVSLAALGIIGAATANFLPSFDLPLPNFDRFTPPKFDRVSLPKFDHIPWPSFSRGAPPNSNRVAAQPPPKPVLVPDPFVHAALRDIQSSQDQQATVLTSLSQSTESQQADLRRISRQLYALTAQVNALQGSAGPLTTSSIPKARARFVRTSRKTIPAIPATPALPKPVGPVSVGGAPLAPPSGSGV